MIYNLRAFQRVAKTLTVKRPYIASILVDKGFNLGALGVLGGEKNLMRLPCYLAARGFRHGGSLVYNSQM